MTHTEWVQLVRFYLDQLASQNAHHDFEKLCFAFARARIASNLVPATGPVAAGGDQGRDFETFRTYFVPEPHTGLSRRLAAGEPISFACTTQREGLRGKIRSDVEKIMAPPEDRAGPLPKAVFVFTAGDVPVALRHELQAWARGEYSVELNVIDGSALAEHLADHDLHWAAAVYLRLPRELAPPAPPKQEEEDDPYARTRAFWRGRQPDPRRLADFYELKSASREAAGFRRHPEDVPLWIEKLRVFERRSGLDRGAEEPDPVSTHDPVARSALYEIALASALGLGSLRGMENEVRAFFQGVASLGDPTELEDATTLLLNVINVFMEDGSSLQGEEIHRWKAAIREALESAAQSPPGPSGRCMLLETCGILALAPDPESGAIDGVDEAVRWFFAATEAVPGAPLYPLERFADRLTHVTDLLGHHPRFAELAFRVDDLLAQRTGPFAAAEKARDRAMVFIGADDWLPAVEQLHHAVGKWFSEEMLWGSVASMILLSSCYRELRLNAAAKLYALGAAFASSHSDQPRVLALLPRALEAAARAEYGQGAWLGFLGLAGMAIRAETLARNSQDQLAAHWRLKSPDLLMRMTQGLVTARAIARRMSPGVSSLFDQAVDSWADPQGVEIVGPTADQVWERRPVDEVVRKVVNQIGAPPLTDVGPERVLRFSALGIDWRIMFPNTYDATARAEEFAAILQVILVELATREVCLLPGSVEFRIRLSAAGDTYVPLDPEDGTRRWLVTLRPIPEEAAPADQWFEAEGLDLLALVLAALRDMSVLPQEPFMREFERLMERGLGAKVMIARPYHQLFSAFTVPEAFAESTRRNAEVRRSAAITKPEPYRSLSWRSGPGPTYSDESAREWIGNRYRRAVIPIQRTIRRLRVDPGFQATLANLRADGWKDWHVLLAILNVALQHRVRAGENAARWIDTAEGEGAPALPVSAFTESALRDAIRISQPQTISQIDLELYQRDPDPAALDAFLRERYQYWTDDVEHEDPFALVD